jgi:hypothetical protein
MNILDKIVPMPHSVLQDHYRVPVYKRLLPDVSYTIYVGKDMTRMYAKETLPPFVQTKITIADATCDNVPNDDTISNPLQLFSLAWDNSTDEKFNTAWRASTSFYIVVMTKVELFGLRGEM